MGQLKQLLPIKNKPAILHCIDTIIFSGIDEIIAVVRDDSEALIKLLNGLPLRIVFNRNVESEMAESVRIGLHATDASSTGVMVCPSDHPLVTAETYKILLQAHGQEAGRILIPCFNGRKGHPVLFPKDVIQAVFSGMNLREVMNASAQKVRLVQVMDEGVLFDMDTREDYENILKRI